MVDTTGKRSRIDVRVARARREVPDPAVDHAVLVLHGCAEGHRTLAREPVDDRMEDATFEFHVREELLLEGRETMRVIDARKSIIAVLHL